jgi:hypothetical protein
MDSILATAITAGASLGTNPMVDMGDDVNGNINAGVAYLNLKCNSQAGCSGIRARGINDLSFIDLHSNLLSGQRYRD